jgi:hypothetical protein
MREYSAQILLLLFSFAVGLISAWKGLFSKEENIEKRRMEKRLAVIGLIFLTLILTVQGYLIVDKQIIATGLERQNFLLDELSNKAFHKVPEASGGVAIGEYAYLVSDERVALFRTKYNPDDGKYSTTVVEIPLYFENPLETEKDKKIEKVKKAEKVKIKPAEKNQKPEAQEKHAVLSDKDVDDIEGAAYHKGKIYLITSHSENKKGETKSQRQRFLEIQLIKTGEKDGEPVEIAVVTRWANLREELEKSLFADGKTADRFVDKIEGEEVTVVMEIEGLAIGSDGMVYLGFRGPVKKMDTDALVAKTNLANIFAGGADEKWKPKPGGKAENSPAKFEVFPVNIGNHPQDRHGIVDMAYYKAGLLLLTNSAYKDFVSKSVEIWRWTNGNGTQLINDSFYNSPENVHVKPEVLLLPENPSDKGFLFLDGIRVGGGQRVYKRKEDLRIN